MVKDVILCLQEAAADLIFKDNSIPKKLSECLINPPCGCANPGQELKCEDCTYLEACLSSIKLSSSEWE
ncbi:hypothetical protein [Nostoc sp. PCC 7107]|uniref:hypothetical protein n=1 Tax=Nostoc sp. PCC 7107 TaxID=317936 RepID=UPI00029F1480|nr:hypothetical protein [Nostoc sp. PCC 7107]AFY45136.1 hypothetical protein Nos7107_4606 [Nostoc sp. PCC 7107]